MSAEGRWVPVREAASSCCIAERTLYAKAKSKGLTSRKIHGVLNVDLAEVQEFAANRAVAPGGCNAPGNSPRADDPPAIQSAKARLLTKSLEAEELRVSVAAEKTRDELAAAEAERERRQVLLQIEVERQRLGFEREQEQIGRERAEAAERAAAEQRQRDAEADKAQRKREQEREVREREAAHRRWANQWASTVGVWMRNLGMPALVPEAFSLANGVLSRCSGDEPDDVVLGLLKAAFDREFAPILEKHDREALQESRMLAAQRAAADFANRYGPAVHERVLRATLDAAERVDPWTGSGRQWVLDNAQRELDAWRAEREIEDKAAREQRERVREEEAKQRRKADEQERLPRQKRAEEQKRQEDDLEWARIARSLTELASRELPCGADQSERADAEAILKSALENRGESTRPYEFASVARDALRALCGRVEVRQQEDEKCRRWAAFVEEGVVELRRHLPPEATDVERRGAEEELRRGLESAKKRGGASSLSLLARADATNLVALPVWRRVAIDRAMGDVKEKLPEEVVMKAYRAAARAAQPERERYTIQRAASSAVTRVLSEYRLDEALQQIRSVRVG